MFLKDLADDLLGDGMPDLSAQDIATIRNKYSAENMQSVYGRIIEQYGLPANVKIEGQTKEIPLAQDLKDESVRDRLDTAFAGNKEAIKGLSALSFAARAQSKAQSWLKTYEHEQQLERERWLPKPERTSAIEASANTMTA